MNKGRRDISTPRHGATIPPPEGKTISPKKKQWEEAVRHSPDYCQISFRRIPHTLRDRLNDIAQEHEVPMEQVGRLFLEYALEAYDQGEITVQTVLDHGRLKIFRDGE